MIIINISGGLGNQLFRYAFARILSKELNEELLIDLSRVRISTTKGHEIYGLHPYNIKGNVGNFNPIEHYKYFLFLMDLSINFEKSKFIIMHPYIGSFINIILKNIRNFLNKYLNKKIGYYRYELLDLDYLYKDVDRIRVDNLNSADSLKFLHGNFISYNIIENKLYTSEKFFKRYYDLLHEDFKYMIPLTKESKEIYDEMQKYDSVCLHIRHGDYEGLLDYGLCSTEYYEKSIETIASKLENPKFFIFSNNMENAKKIIKSKYPYVFVDFEDNNELIGKGNGELLKLMSSCKHFIIANSTFSWWAAFLSENPEKIIITPEPWFQSRELMGIETIDNKKPIRIINNHGQVFNNSDNIVYKINDNNLKFKKIYYKKIDDYYKLTSINQKSKILLKDSNNKEYKRLIVKISIKSNCFNCLKILFKTKEKKKYSKEFFNLYCYKNEEFDHYLILPKNAIIDDLMIKPSIPFENEEELIIKSIEIKEIDKVW